MAIEADEKASRLRLGMLATSVAVGTLTALLVVAAHGGAGAADMIFLFGLVLAPRLLITVPLFGEYRASLLAIRHARILGVATLILVVTAFISWGPFYRQLAGAPIAGFLCVAAGEMLGSIGLCISMVYSRVSTNQDIPGVCACGYVLYGLPAHARCPECGRTTGTDQRGRGAGH